MKMTMDINKNMPLYFVVTVYFATKFLLVLFIVYFTKG